MADKQVDDHNAFNRWDCVGASAMLAIFPAVLCIVFNDKDIRGALMWGGIAAAVAGAVYLLSFVIKERILGKLVNLTGWAVTICYLVVSTMMLIEKIENTAEDPALEKKAAEQKKTESAEKPASAQ